MSGFFATAQKPWASARRLMDHPGCRLPAGEVRTIAAQPQGFMKWSRGFSGETIFGKMHPQIVIAFFPLQ